MMHSIDLKWQKRRVTTIYNNSISNKCWSFELFNNQRVMKKSIPVSTKILSSTTVFNINNNVKCFLSSKIRMISEDHVTLKTGVMIQKIQRCITGIHYILRCIQIENSYFKLLNIWQYYSFYCIYFWSNKFSPDEQKRIMNSSVATKPNKNKLNDW